MALQLFHGTYSTIRYYDSNLIPSVQAMLKCASNLNSAKERQVAIKTLSAVLGALGATCLFGFWFFAHFQSLLFGTVVFGVFHFYFMEIDYKYVLRVRPAAYLPLILLNAVLINAIISILF